MNAQTTTRERPAANTATRQGSEGTDRLMEGDTAETIAKGSKTPAKATKGGLISQMRTEVSAGAVAKMQLLGTVRQQLAEAVDRYNQSGDESNEAQSIATEAATKLYQARIDGVLSNDEVTNVLGDVFGWRKKGDAKQRAEHIDERSKTPFGQGANVQKRIVRAVKAYEYANGGEPDRFFEPLDKDEVSDVLSNMDNGELSIWEAYNELQNMRKGETPRVNAAFNPAVIARIVDRLSEKGAAEQFVNNPALARAYGALMDVLNVIDAETAKAE
jgi:hypothetical protein